MLTQQHDMAPLSEVTVPDRLIPLPELDALLTEHSPEFVPVLGREDEGPLPAAEASSGVVQRRLSNGVTLNYKVSANEPGSASARLCCSGGRAAEPRSGPGVGAMQVGMRARAPPSLPSHVAVVCWSMCGAPSGAGLVGTTCRHE